MRDSTSALIAAVSREKKYRYDSSASSAVWAAMLSASGTQSSASILSSRWNVSSAATRAAHLSSTPPVSAALMRSGCGDRDPELPDALFPLGGAALVDGLAPRVDRHGDRHVFHLELVDRLHAEIGEGEHARLADRPGDEVRGAAHRDERCGLVLANCLDRRG